MKKLHKNVFCQTTSDGANIGCVIGEDAVVCIDLPLDPAEARAWRAQIGEISDHPIRAVIFTASDRMNDESLAAMNASAAVLHNAAFAHVVAVPVEPMWSSPFDLPPAPVAGEFGGTPSISFSDAMSIVLGAKHTVFVDVAFQGGYSPDACFVTLRDSGIVFTGDHVAVGQPPNLSKGNLESWQAILVNLKKSRIVTTVVPGRGPAGEPAKCAEATLDYIKSATLRVKALVRAGRDRKEVAALVPDLMALYAPKSARSKSSPAYELLSQEVRAGLEHLYDELQTQNQT